MARLNLTKERLQDVLHTDMNVGEQGHLTSEIVRNLGEEGTLEFMESVRDKGESFKWSVFKRFVDAKLRSGEMRESGQSATAFAPYFRLGTQVLVVGGYDTVNLPYADLVKTTASDSLVKPYASGYRPTMPQKGFGGITPKAVSFTPRSTVVTNEDFNSFFSIQRTAIEDDQTGQFMITLKQMGENHNVQRQVYFDGFISGAARNSFGVNVPAPAYTDTDGTPGIYVAARGNRPTSFGSLTEGNIETGLQSLMTMAQPGATGQLILVRPDVLYTSVKDKFNARRILNSDNTPGPTDTNTANANIGGAFAVNPIKGELKPVVSAHLTTKAWYIMESKAPSIIIQERHPLETAMEDPNAGKSFEERSYRYRTFMRWAMFWYEARYIYQGNDGSV